MHHFEPSTHRAAFAVAAVAMTAITITLLVVLPSKMEPESQTFLMLAESKLVSVPTAAAIGTSRCVDVDAHHELN